MGNGVPLVTRNNTNEHTQANCTKVFKRRFNYFYQACVINSSPAILKPSTDHAGPSVCPVGVFFVLRLLENVFLIVPSSHFILTQTLNHHHTNEPISELFARLWGLQK